MNRATSILHVALVLALAAPAAGASAADAPADTSAPRTLQDYLARARAANPSIQGMLAGARAATERAGVTSGYPDPLLMYGYWVAPDAMQGRQELEVLQRIPFPGKRGLRGNVAAYEADMAARTADAYALDVDLMVATAFYEFVRAREVERVLNDEHTLIVHMRDVARVRYGAGTAEQQELLKLELALSQILDALTTNQHEEDQARIRLNELMGRRPEAPLPEPEWRVPDAAAAAAAADADSALVHRPEVASARAGIERAESAHALARREYIPDFMLGVMFEFGAGMDETWELRAGIELPLWLGKRRAAVREAEALREAAQHQMDAQELRVWRDLEHALHGVYSARDRLERFESLILPQAEQTFRSSEAGYRAGRVDFMDFLDSERMLLSMRREYYRVVADLGIQVAALERAMGRNAGE